MRDILYITDFMIAGGVERQLTELVLRLDQNRYKPHVVCLYGKRAERNLHFLPRLQAAGVPVTVLDLDWSATAKLCGIAAIANHARKLRPAVIHAMNYHANLLSRLARPFFPRKTSLIGAVRTAYTPKQLLYERLSWRMCAVITCNSPHLADQLTQIAHVPPDRVQFVPNGVDMERFGQPIAREEIAQLRDDARQVILLVGRITRQKAPDLLVKALGQLKRDDALPAGLRAWILGDSEDEFVQTDVDNAIAADDLNDVVQQMVPIPDTERVYQAADLIVLPSLYEGMPNVVLEALASGRPVIISKDANRAQIIEEGVTGWVVNTGDVDHLAQCIRQALAADLPAMHSACRTRAEYYSMANMVRRYEALYDSLSVKPGPSTT